MDRPPPAFRISPQVFQMAGIALVALALPITILILGLRSMSQNAPQNSPQNPAEPAPEMTQLRTSAEAAAAQILPDPTLSDGRRIVTVPAGESAAARSRVESAAKAVGGTVLPDGDRWLVRLPEGTSSQFTQSAGIPPGTDATLYEIHFSAP